MTHQTNTDWIAEGAHVAEYSNRMYTDRVSLATIDKLTKTQIVLDNGRRYRRDNLRLVGESRDISGWTELRSAADPAILDVQARDVLAGLVYRVGEMNRSAKDGRRLNRDAVLAALDEIGRAVSDARRAVEGE